MTPDERIAKWLQRPMSWSQISSWEWGSYQWFEKYILDKPIEETVALKFGKEFATAVEHNKHTVPLTVYKKNEYEIRGTYDGIPYVGILDSWNPETKELAEYKTGVKKWDAKRVSGHRQLTFYAMLLYLFEGIKPEEVKMILQHVPTEVKSDFTYNFVDENKVLTFETSRTMLDVLELMKDIKVARVMMEKYARSRL